MSYQLYCNHCDKPVDNGESTFWVQIFKGSFRNQRLRPVPLCEDCARKAFKEIVAKPWKGESPDEVFDERFNGKKTEVETPFQIVYDKGQILYCSESVMSDSIKNLERGIGWDKSETGTVIRKCESIEELKACAEAIVFPNKYPFTDEMFLELNGVAL